MLFFGKKKEKECVSGLDVKYINFLNAADNEYMRAFSTRSMRTLKNYLTRECAVTLSRSIFAMGSRYFGAEKFRETKWTLLSRDGDVLTVLKDVTFDSIKVAGSLYIDVADNYKEVWELDISNSNLIISDIISYKEYNELLGVPT